MPNDMLLWWNTLAMPLILAVSTTIGVMVYRFTRRQAQMQALQLIHSRWQEINRAMIERPQVQRLLDDRKFADKSDDEIIAAYGRFGNGAYHASGSCRMGTDDDSVVDQRLRVRGLEGVRVIDTSIMPFLVAGNTAGPAMAMAWRAADLVLADANLKI